MNKIELDNDVINCDKDKVLYLFDDKNKNYTFNVEDSKLIVYHYVIDSTINVEINLNSINSEIEYHYSIINYNDNNYKIEVNHNYKNTYSNIYNHGVNINNNKLHFDIIGSVGKDISGCICNQENQIININDGNSTILPKLLIENYDIDSSHSAYIGKFSEDILFYLMSRGISKDSAYQMLIKSLLINGGEESVELEKFKEKIESI